jgi:uncharacterized membrane protein YccC
VSSYDKAWLDAAMPDIAKGVRGAVATLLPFYLAARLGRHEFAWMALGGWLGTLLDPGGLRSTRAKTLTLFAIAGGATVLLSEHIARSPWSSACALFVLAFFASLLRSLGAVWASVGTMLAIVLAIGCAQVVSAPLRDGSFFAAGAGFAVLLSSVIWPIWTHLPLRRAEANVFECLARYAAAIEVCLEERAPEGDARWIELGRLHHRLIRNAVEEARRLALGGRARRAGETRLGANLRVLLGLAESQFPLLITLKEASEFDSAQASNAALLRRLTALSRRNLATATILRTPNLHTHQARPSLPPPASTPGQGSSIATLLEHLDDASRTAHALSSSLDARVEAATEQGASSGPRLGELIAVWRGDWATLRDACSARSTFFQHGLRVGCALFVASLISHRISLHPHWVTVTTLAVLQPYSGATATRAAQRVLGTVLGSVAAAAINMTLQSPLLLSAVMFPLSVAAVATHRRNYRLFTFFLTPVFVLLAERFQGDWWTAAARAGDAIIGGSIAFVAAVVIFPSRERSRLPELLARMLDALSDYAEAVLAAASVRHSETAEAGVLSARRAAGIALSEAENSLERLLGEPRHDLSAQEFALQLVTYGRRAASALTAIDTYSARDLGPGAALSPDLAHSLQAYVVATLRRAACFARGAEPATDPKMPELSPDLDSRLRSTLSRLLRSARLVADISRRGL